MGHMLLPANAVSGEGPVKVKNVCANGQQSGRKATPDGVAVRFPNLS